MLLVELMFHGTGKLVELLYLIQRVHITSSVSVLIQQAGFSIVKFTYSGNGVSGAIRVGHGLGCNS
jgi:hypothetical protein